MNRSIPSMDILNYVKTMPGATINDVASFFNANRKSMGHRLTKFYKDGLVRFVPGATHEDPYKWYATGKEYKAGTRGHEWPEERKDKLREMFATAPWGELVKEFYPKPRATIAEMARRMQLKRPRNIGRDHGKASIHRVEKMLNALRQKTHERHMEEDRPHVVICSAKAADTNIVSKAIAQRTPLEQAWSMR